MVAAPRHMATRAEATIRKGTPILLYNIDTKLLMGRAYTIYLLTCYQTGIGLHGGLQSNFDWRINFELFCP